MRDRIKYLDIAKFIGIFCIYIGHFGSYAGNMYLFVFQFHVPLFFILSGCAENLGSDVPWYKYIEKTTKTILIPSFLFALASVVLRCISTDTYTEVYSDLLRISKGMIRNDFFAGSLWFLTCLYVMKIAFYFLRKLLKFKPLILVASLGFFAFSILVIWQYRSIPSMIYNVDSACYYVGFYGLGYCLFKPVHQILLWDRPYKKAICIGLCVPCLVYTAFLFFGKDLLSPFVMGNITFLIYTMVMPLPVIFLILNVSRLLENVTIFNEIGKETLYLCGSEYLIKLLFPCFLQVFGLSVSFSDPVVAWIYTFVLLIVCMKTLVPFEKTVFRKLHLIN